MLRESYFYNECLIRETRKQKEKLEKEMSPIEYSINDIFNYSLNEIKELNRKSTKKN